MGKKKVPDSQGSANRFPGDFLARPGLRDECVGHMSCHPPSSVEMLWRGMDPVSLAHVHRHLCPASMPLLSSHTYREGDWPPASLAGIA